MAGQFLNKEQIKSSLRTWLIDISKNSKERNNLHIDEIKTFENIKREKWIYDSLSVLEILLTEIRLINSYIIFLHIDLSDSKERETPDLISLEWIEKNKHEHTPPSFHCTTFENYDEFYKKELSNCVVDNSLLNLFKTKLNLQYMYRTYYDDSEGMYARELYVFFIPRV